MNKYFVTYYDEIEATTLEEAKERLLVVLKSDIEYEDLEAFKFTEEEVVEVDEDIDPPDWSEGAVDPDSKYSDYSE